jgi:hypothetical protein
MKNIVYRQCRLVKRIPNGECIQMSWLPSEFAREGRILKLRDDEGNWDDGWVVREVGNTASEAELTLTDQMLHRMQR